MTAVAMPDGLQGCRMAGAFASALIPAWLDLALPAGTDPAPVIEELAREGGPVTTLTQARTVFMLAHLGRLTGDARLVAAAGRICDFLRAHLRDADGGCRYSVAADGTPLEDPGAALRRSYDQTFVLLALVTLRDADPQAVAAAEIDGCWDFIDTVLTDRVSDALWEDDRMAARGAGPDDLRAQNPHMHLLEAVLQCLELTGDRIWADRADWLVAVAERYFIDPSTGAVREFTGPDFRPLDTAAGLRREPGHQYEWAWLLERHALLTGRAGAAGLVPAMHGFVTAHGWQGRGPMEGALFDAVDAQGRVTEETHLLWPLTEAGKFYAARARETGDAAAAERARQIAEVIFGRYFDGDGRPAWVNQFDAGGNVSWPAGLSRLLYHVALFVTEGASAGLWPLAAPASRS
ncbi:AGE family epimerase/isomerase [Mangrovicoccus algicola]|uniref:AGE family epimerase/isomerase n=1 Tax=Mangrovicoccus algicola TaxID=2771008 RepID=A0A8J7CG43_9RHOB|nr:AGE family epimerase/isomerase [Mangrovicoccus algicola]MBE3636780.1 AGE family epimerase/isomerase [Mangrovicoccus algicola]